MTAQAVCLKEEKKKKKKQNKEESGPSSLTVTEAPVPSRSLVKRRVWFWHFVNVVSETCQSPWFNTACCCSWSPGAYIMRVPVRGDWQYVCTFIIDFAALKPMFAYKKRKKKKQHTSKKTVSRYIFQLTEMRWPESRTIIIGRELASEWSLRTDVDLCLSRAQMGRWRH